jgi:hypothetical protein
MPQFTRAAIVKDLLWDIVVDGEPLHALVVYLPTRAPKLNPIELLPAKTNLWAGVGVTGGVFKNISALENTIRLVALW